MSVEERIDLRTEFETQGYIIVRKFFSEDEVDELRMEIKKAGESLEKPSGLNKGGLIFYSNIFLKSAYIQSFITQEKVVDLLKDIIGNDFWVRWDQCVAKGPEGAATQALPRGRGRLPASAGAVSRGARVARASASVLERLRAGNETAGEGAEVSR